MSHRIAIRRRRVSTTLARYLAGRRATADRVGATTPFRFLRRLDLWTDGRDPEIEWRGRFDFAFDEPAPGSAGSEDTPFGTRHIIDRAAAAAPADPEDATTTVGVVPPSSDTGQKASFVRAVAPVATSRSPGRRRPATALSPPGAIEPAERPMARRDVRLDGAAGTYVPMLAPVDGASSGVPASVAESDSVPEPVEMPALSQQNAHDLSAHAAVAAHRESGPSISSAPREATEISDGIEHVETVSLPATTPEVSGWPAAVSPDETVVVAEAPHREAAVMQPQLGAPRPSSARDGAQLGDVRRHVVGEGNENATDSRATTAPARVWYPTSGAPPEASEPARPPDSSASVASSSRRAAAVPEDQASGVPALADEPLPHLPRATPRRRRAHVEELPSEPTRAALKRPAADAPTAVATPTRSERSSASASSLGVPVTEPSRARAADTLFQPTDTIDTSPAAWAARLARSARRSAPQHPAAPPTNAAKREGRAPSRPTGTAATPPADHRRPDRPVTLSERTRRFLKPLVGIDPSSVAIWQGPQSTALAAHHRADGITVEGKAIVLRAPVDEETPEDVGLLAHELSHVARHQRPRFVPPIARRSFAVRAAQDEEAIARRVEARVIGIARREATLSRHHSPAADPPAPAPEGFPTAALLPGDSKGERARAVPPSASTVASNPRDADTSASPTSPDWAGLPAPWEPMPAWATSWAHGDPPLAAPASSVAPDAVRESRPAALGVHEPATAGPSAAGGAPAKTAGLSLQLADEKRALEREFTAGVVAAETPKVVAPDLDLLARQVYAVLKRRLGGEMRREQPF